MTTADETTAETAPRFFWKSDYAKAARLVRNMRHLRCQPYTPKPDQGPADALAEMLAMAFHADSEAFDHGKFLAGTQLPGNGYEAADDDEASEDDGQ